MTSGLMLYDADCGFCTRSAHYVQAHRFAVTVRSMQSTDLEALGVSPERAARELPFVAADGHVSYGYEAIGHVLRTGRLPHQLAGWVVLTFPVRYLSRWAYTQIAAHRHQLPGGTAACALPAPPVPKP